MNVTILSFSPKPKRKYTETVVDAFDCISKVNELKRLGYSVYEVDTEDNRRFLVSKTDHLFEPVYKLYLTWISEGKIKP